MTSWTYINTLTSECLYATWEGQRAIEVTQYVLPGYVKLITEPIWKEPQMRGMWSGEKPSNASYRPALDGLSSIDPRLVRDAIVAAIGTGAAVSVSCTRDFGALVITLLDGASKVKVYPTDAQEIEQAFQDLLDSFTSETPPQVITPKPRKA